jgi:hypothetical protein
MHSRAAQSEDEHQRHERVPFRRVHSSHISPVVHIARTAATLSPLLLQEFVEDPNKRWRYARMAILGATLIDQIAFAVTAGRESKERQRCEDRSWVDRSRPQENADRTVSR